jgi:hypothetical protein
MSVKEGPFVGRTREKGEDDGRVNMTEEHYMHV